MRGLATLLTLALVCGVCRPEVRKTKHFETVYAWSGIDYVFPDEEARNRSLQDGSFIPGNSVPWGLDVDPETGRVFLGIVKINAGIPASLVTVTATKNHKGEHLVQPYPDWSWHTKGCDGITSVEKMDIDECNRLWVLDSGSVYLEGMFGPKAVACPPKILVFDLKTDQLIRSYKIPEIHVDDDESLFSNIVAEVVSKEHECKDTFAYVTDSGVFTMFVYDFAQNDSWMVEANEMYPYPEYGTFYMNGTRLDFMYGVFSMVLSPVDGDHGRTLYFNSFSSGKESFVRTSYLRNKDNFKTYNHLSTDIKTHPLPRPGGMTGSEVMDENGVMFFTSMEKMSVYCWQHQSEYNQDHMAEVDGDDEAFQVFADMDLVKKDGVSYVYILTNQFHKFVFGNPGMDEVHFRVMKAPTEALIQGTVCMPNELPTK